MPKFHTPEKYTLAAIEVDSTEYNYLVQCHAILQMVINYTGYDKNEIVSTATVMFKELDGGPANE